MAIVTAEGDELGTLGTKLMVMYCTGCEEELKLVLPVAVTTLDKITNLVQRIHDDCEPPTILGQSLYKEGEEE